MYSQRRGVTLWLGLVLMLVSILAASVACWGEPIVPLQIENRSEIVLTIYVQGVKFGEVEPNNSIKVKYLGVMGHYLIEAKNSKGELIYTREFDYHELRDADWKVVIPPSQIKQP